MRTNFFRKRGEAEEITPVVGPDEAQAQASGIDHLKHLRQFEKLHKLDPNLPIDELSDIDAAIATGNAEKGIEIEHALMEDNSPYPEVGLSRPAKTAFSFAIMSRLLSTIFRDTADADTRFELSFVTTILTYQQTPFVHGLLVWCFARWAPAST